MVFYTQDDSVKKVGRGRELKTPTPATIRRLVLDVLKPHQPSILDLAQALGSLEGVLGVNLSLYEVDQETENVRITIEGNSIDYTAVERTLNELGAVVHSIDEVAAGTKLVEVVETLQDR
ncbi:DUF211 domain-containing protein [Methermicoccus shengliensis]|uniref:DUF211 domain-containing protein n=1 Tax=Methermicoccus shengliensis TaxID=660064 RepID=A0A832RX82_9EURY|nr:MAG: Uncharacterized protein conserved in archaea [Euryarchaeota archaeon 55_53]KUK29805.1 MAG: Uncharacterized protein conserved in archaea [Methanosarcinales archeaon 56_1174]MDI3488393.1 uncharacterized protein [Methanosarcinales archaeon]MDN5295043.1 uncharacterized protein [Methanosarcinales archaeon]HIH69066.1 DUF211 domain-containing protein [Methermicoccus shengliensis]